MNSQPLRVGIGGPVGSGKTALTLALCLALRDRYNLAVVTNDIYTREDADFLVRNEALAPERIIGVETGGCPHTAIREDASINLEAVDQLNRRFEGLDLIHRRVRRRQPVGDVQPGAVGPHHLRDRRFGRRQAAAQGWSGHLQIRSAGDQQDRPRAAGRRLAGDDGQRHKKHARRQAVRVQQPENRSGPGSRSSPSSSARAC